MSGCNEWTSQLSVFRLHCDIVAILSTPRNENNFESGGGTAHRIVGRKVAEEVVKRSFQNTVPTDADRSDPVLRFLKTPIELTVGATNYLNNLHAWLRRSTPPWLSIGRGG